MHNFFVLSFALVLVGTASASLPGFLARPFEGEWIYVEDRTAGRPLEDHQPSMSARVVFRMEDNTFVWARRDGDQRIPLNGNSSETTANGTITRVKGTFVDGVIEYETRLIRESDQVELSLIRREIRLVEGGLHAHVRVGNPTTFESLAYYRHPEDIPLPTPAKAVASDLAWMSGDWVGTRGTAGTTTIEERWGPVKGGSLFGVSRTVTRDALAGFEFLRVVQREGGLVYIAQPRGAAPTEFVATEVSAKRAVFENPRHDSPQRITYELVEGGLTATIGYIKGGRGQKFEFKAEK
ncbi:MAG: hypothetical protein JNJ45_08450 [Chthonomonas sp.]|nr:hypothetical protein [Chthonomonas sp.]